MYSQYSSMRKILINDGRVTNLVTTSNIRVGYVEDEIKYPTISIFRGGGSSNPKLGYNTSNKGHKDRETTAAFQIDIFHRNSIEEVEKIDDAVMKALHSGASVGVGLTMSSNPSIWDPTHNSYRIMQTWIYSDIESD